MKQFSRHYPGIAIKLRGAQDHSIIAALRRGGLDVVVVSGGRGEEEFQSLLNASDHLIAIVAENMGVPLQMKAEEFGRQ